MRHPLQTGATMLRGLLLTTVVLVALVAIYGWLARPTLPWETPMAGIAAFQWLLLCPVTALVLAARIGRTRASDCEIGPKGFRVFGGAFDKLAVAWSTLRMEGTSLHNGRLVLDLGDGVKIGVAAASVPGEQSSLQALLETVAYHQKHATTDDAPQTLAPSVLRCSNCGASAVVDDAPQVTCHACGQGVAIAEPTRAKIRAARALGKEQAAVAALVLKALNQPSAKRINQWLIALAILGIVWLPAPAMLLARTTTAVSIVAFFLLYWYTYSLIANRRALAVLIAECGAHRVNDTYCCCACGAPLPVAQESDIVCQCAYCSTDNLLGFDLVRERKSTNLARTTLVDAYATHLRTLKRARVLAASATLLTLIVYALAT